MTKAKDIIELEITSLGKQEEFEYGIDQFKNVYQRLIGKVSWECIFEYRRIPATRPSNSQDMSLIAEIGIFSFAVDSEGKYWKKLKNQVWTEFTDGKDKPKCFMHKIIATQGNYYWEQQKNNKTIKRKVDTSNMGHIVRSKEYYDFIPCSRKRRQTQIDRYNYGEQYLNRKKAKEEIYDRYFVLSKK